MRITKKDSEIKFRVPRTLKEQAQLKATAQLSTLSAVLRWLLSDWVKGEGEGEGDSCAICGAPLPPGSSPYHVAPSQPGVFLCQRCGDARRRDRS